MCARLQQQQPWRVLQSVAQGLCVMAEPLCARLQQRQPWPQRASCLRTLTRQLFSTSRLGDLRSRWMMGGLWPCRYSMPCTMWSRWGSSKHTVSMRLMP